MPFLSLLSLFLFSQLIVAHSKPPRGVLIDCGATVSSVIEDREWLSDTGFVSSGTPKNLTTSVLVPILSTVRSFPLRGNVRRKFCYVVPVYRTGKYLIRTTYFYGGINGKDLPPPVFDQIVDGTVWSVVNTTEDFSRGMSSYYEGIFVAGGKTMSVCVAANTYTDSDPFISALEFVLVDDSLYNSTNFVKYGLSLVARHSFGYNGSIIRYPDDIFDRFWEPFGEDNHTIARARNVSVSGFWNLPPLKIFQTELRTSEPRPLELQWPLISLPNSTYYIALYFADDRVSSSAGSRVFNVSINDVIYYPDLNVDADGVVVFANSWPLVGLTKITLSPAVGSSIGPLINAGEVFNVLLLGGRTLTRDVNSLINRELVFSQEKVQVIALEKVKNSFQNPPIDWNGDPCSPHEYSWTGVTCSEGPRIRVTALNLTSMDISGSLSPSIANLTALTDIWLGNNSLTGSIPDLSPLKRLEKLHLEDNQLTGEIPPSLGNIDSLHELSSQVLVQTSDVVARILDRLNKNLFLQDNNLTGQVPNSLVTKPGLNLKTSPGNQFLPPPPN